MSSKSKSKLRANRLQSARLADIPALLAHGVECHKAGQFDQAQLAYEQILTTQPKHVDALQLLGLVAQHFGRLQQSIDLISQAIALLPGHAAFYSYRGNAYLARNQLDAAIADYDHAISLNPGFAEAYANKGYALRLLNQPGAAVKNCDAALQLMPSFAAAHWNRALALLVSGNYAAAWGSFEWRWQLDIFAFLNRGFSQPRWTGKEALDGKTVLLYTEQGFGDSIQFCRYVPLLARRGARVILEVEAPLMRLFSSLEGVTQYVLKGEALPHFDFYCPLLSLPPAFGTELATIPAPRAYLRSDPIKRYYWQQKLGQDKAVRIGLVWAGAYQPNETAHSSWSVRRNIPLEEFALLKHDKVSFYSLQKGGHADAELSALLSSGWDGPEITDFTSELADFSDTAALIDNLDLVISVDTSTAHLAAALGKPVWLLNRFDTCWRWLLEREDSPWYPTLRLFRQKRPNDWGDVMNRVKVALDSLVA